MIEKLVCDLDNRRECAASRLCAASKALRDGDGRYPLQIGAELRSKLPEPVLVAADKTYCFRGKIDELLEVADQTDDYDVELSARGLAQSVEIAFSIHRNRG